MKAAKRRQYELSELLQGVNQRELAREIGTDNGSISRYKRGKAIPSGPRLQKIARHFGISADDIILPERVA